MIGEKITDIKSLAQQKALTTSELYKFNDTYGHAHILKKYARIKDSYQIKGIIEHAAMVFDHVWFRELSLPLPALFTFSSYRFPYLRQITNKALFAIGPSIHYADKLFSEEELKNLKKAMGKTLLVFLPHSAMSLVVDFDHSVILNHIKNLEKDYDNIMICLGWKDVLRDFDKPYRAEGYTCVTAGHVFDFNFLPRLKSLILLSDHTMSFSFDTHIGFCIYLNKPHWVFPIKTTVDGPPEIKKIATYKPTPLSQNQTKYFLDQFKEPREDISENQLQLVDMFWGISSIKSPEELREIFSITEDMFHKKYLPNNKRDPISICQIFDYLDQKNINKCKTLMELSKQVYFHPAWNTLIKAYMSALDKKTKEVEKLTITLKKYGDSFTEIAQKILNIANKDGIDNENMLDALLNTYPRPQYYMHKKMSLPWRS